MDTGTITAKTSDGPIDLRICPECFNVVDQYTKDMNEAYGDLNAGMPNHDDHSRRGFDPK